MRLQIGQFICQQCESDVQDPYLKAECVHVRSSGESDVDITRR